MKSTEKEKFQPKAFVNSTPVMFPTKFAENEMEELQKSDMTIEQEVEMEKNYLGRLFKYSGSIDSIKCK